jgi:hypothetical protein
VPVAVKEAAVLAFGDIVNPNAPLIACAACGVRHYELAGAPTASFVITDAMLGPLRYSQLDLLAFNAKSANFRTLKSSYAHDGERYHVHQELVCTRDGSPTVPVCATCVGALKAKHAPRLSIAAGIDFGIGERLGLRPLSLLS